MRRYHNLPDVYKRQDIVVLDAELKVKAVFVGGEKVVG